MLIYKNGDILKATENIICHQVNEDGVMGGGLALQIATKYPLVEAEYKEICSEHLKDKLYGNYQVCKVENKKYIANCFTQRDFITNLDYIKRVFIGLLDSCKLNKFTIAIPFGYGCGIAQGDWNKVSSLLNEISETCSVDIVVYKHH